MAWSETMFIIQHFYNVFDIDKRLVELEAKSPLVSRSIDGLPELPEETTVEDLTPGTLWFIRDNKIPTMIESLCVLKEDKTFTDPMPFKVDLNNIALNEDIAQIVSSMGLTAQNYYDIIKLMLEILVTVPVERGGTGRTTIGKNKVLVGDDGNKFKEIGFDGAPVDGSTNLVNSSALFAHFRGYAKKNHASTTQDYGVGSDTMYGHLKITDNYEAVGEDAEHTAVSVAGISVLLNSLSAYLNMFDVLDVVSEEDKDRGVEENATLFSGCISAYRPQGMEENELRLIDNYFSIRVNENGNYTLIIV